MVGVNLDECETSEAEPTLALRSRRGKGRQSVMALPREQAGVPV